MEDPTFLVAGMRKPFLRPTRWYIDAVEFHLRKLPTTDWCICHRHQICHIFYTIIIERNSFDLLAFYNTWFINNRQNSNENISYYLKSIIFLSQDNLLIFLFIVVAGLEGIWQSVIRLDELYKFPYRDWFLFLKSLWYNEIAVLQ